VGNVLLSHASVGVAKGRFTGYCYALHPIAGALPGR